MKLGEGIFHYLTEKNKFCLPKSRGSRGPKILFTVFDSEWKTHHIQIFTVCHDMGVSKNRGIPKWMVKRMENPIKMDDLGVPLYLETPIYKDCNINILKTY